MDFRVILYHKQATSARTRFLKHDHESVCAYGALPTGARLTARENTGTPLRYKTDLLKQLEQDLGLPSDCVEVEVDYNHAVDIKGDTIPIFLARITTTDPPFDAVELSGASFIDLTQARDCPAIELELLRKAYELILGG